MPQRCKPHITKVFNCLTRGIIQGIKNSSPMSGQQEWEWGMSARNYEALSIR